MKYLLTAMLFIGMVTSVTAQKGEQRKEMREKMEAKKVEFINERAGLTEVEGEKYWAAQTEMKATKKKIKADLGPLKKLQIDEMSDEDATKYLDGLKRQRKELTAVDETYEPIFVKALGAKKYLAALQAERDFKKEVLRDMRGSDRMSEKEQMMEKRKQMMEERENRIKEETEKGEQMIKDKK